MRLLFLAKRWHLWRHRFAKWALQRIVNPLGLRLGRMVRESGVQANVLNDKARMRYEVCKRCPLFNEGWCDKTRGGCGCWLLGKVQIDGESCPQKRW